MACIFLINFNTCSETELFNFEVAIFLWNSHRYFETIVHDFSTWQYITWNYYILKLTCPGSGFILKSKIYFFAWFWNNFSSWFWALFELELLIWYNFLNFQYPYHLFWTHLFTSILLKGRFYDIHFVLNEKKKNVKGILFHPKTGLLRRI